MTRCTHLLHHVWYLTGTLLTLLVDGVRLLRLCLRPAARSQSKNGCYMSESTDLLASVHRAEEDWLLARSALRRKVPLIYGATFHAQQCAEKDLKALLVSRRQAFARTHDVVALHDLCRRHGLRISIDPEPLERLSAYAVQVR